METIYYNGKSYPIKRTIINKTNFNYKYVSKIYDIKLAIMWGVAKKIPKLFINNWYNRILFFWHPLYYFPHGIVHTYNAIYKGNSKWVCTIENMFPACYYKMYPKNYERYYLRLKKYLLNNRCKKILPISEYSKNVILCDAYKYLSKSEFEIIRSKIKVLHPPQENLISEKEIIKKYSEFDLPKICFVGRDFYRKGGYVALECMKILHGRGIKFQFIIVSSLNSDDACYNHDNKKVAEELVSLPFIKWHKELPNAKVINILKECHLGLLPTFGDTYGFSVLEMQACGCPCVSSNTFALSEINNDEIGWLIDTKKITKKFGEDYNNRQVTRTVENILINELAECLTNILQNTEDSCDLIRNKAILGMYKIIEKNSPEKYSKELMKIYDE